MEETENKSEFACGCFQIKTEMETKEEELPGSTGSLICPECSEHFHYEMYFVEHIMECHTESKLVEQVDVDIYTGVLKYPADNTVDVSQDLKPCIPDQVHDILQPGQGLCDFKEETTTLPNNSERDVVDPLEVRTGKMRYSCSLCSYTSYKMSNMTRHTQSHENLEQCRYPMYSSSSRFKANLLTHK